MSIYLNKDSKIIVQGMTGGMGAKHTTLMVESGANIVGGVNARKAGTRSSSAARSCRSTAPSRRP
jgi:succinyl-CoA synthetase alpha subunit